MKLASTFFFLWLVITSSAQTTTAEQPIILGTQVTFHSSILSENRILNIYLPPGYDKNKSGKYPVVYLLDGGMDEDFIHITGLYQFNSFPWIKRVEPTILVGIVNTDRIRDMTFATSDTALQRLYPASGHSGNFMDFIQKELQPLIEKKYRTSSTKTLIGQSLGGLLATEILLKRPALFDNYMIVSPSLWWDDGSLLDVDSNITDSNYNHQTKVFIAVGKEGLTPGKNPRVMEVDANLLAEKVRDSKSHFVSVCFDYLPLEDHATILHQAISDALKADSSCHCR